MSNLSASPDSQQQPGAGSAQRRRAGEQQQHQPQQRAGLRGTKQPSALLLAVEQAADSARQGARSAQAALRRTLQ
jgi:hypothetical protein